MRRIFREKIMSKRSLFGRARDGMRISRSYARGEKRRRSGFIRSKIHSRYPTDCMFTRIWKSKYYNGQYRGR